MFTGMRCPVSTCRTILVPSGTDLGAAKEAGDIIKHNNVLGFLLNDPTQNESHELTSDAVLVVYAPQVRLARKTDEAQAIGESAYFNGTALTKTGSNLSRCGYFTEDQASSGGDDDIELVFQGDIVDADIAAGS